MQRRKPRVRIWLRVSTDDQDEEQQLEPCLKWIDRQNPPMQFDITSGIYRAHAVSGADSEHALKRKVWRDIEEGSFDVLLVWDLSRWTRGGILELFQDRDRMSRHGVRLASVTDEWANQNELLSALKAFQDRAKRNEVSASTKRALAGLREKIETSGGFWSKRSGRMRHVTQLGRPTIWKSTDLAELAQLVALGRSPAKIAAALGIPRSTVRDQIRRMRGEGQNAEHR